MNRPTYTVAYWPESIDWVTQVWVAEVVHANGTADDNIPGHVTQSASFGELEAEVRDLIHEMAGVPADSFELDMIEGMPLYIRLGSLDDDHYLGVVDRDAEPPVTLLATLASAFQHALHRPEVTA